MESKMNKFILLMWKNFLLQWRHPIQTAAEIIVPIIFTTILVILRSLVYPIEYSASFYLPFETKMQNTSYKSIITWSPPNDHLHTIMDETVNAINLLHSIKFTHRSVSNYSELENFLSNDVNGLLNFAGIAFSDNYEQHDELQPNLSVVFRFPGELNWRTDDIFQVYYIPGVRTRNSNIGGPPSYYKEGFLMLQQQLSLSVINYFKKKVHNTSFDRLSVPIRMQRLPYPKYTQDVLLSALDIYIGTVFMLSFVYTCINIVKVVTTEKEKQLKETMKIMGLPNWLHWTAWFCKSFITIFIAIILMVILLTVKWYPDTNYTIFTHSNPILIFLLLALFTCATITFSFAISTLASKANVGATIAGIAWFMLFSPYMVLQYNYDQMSLSIKLLASLCSNTAVGVAFRLIIKQESIGTGLQWNNIWTPIENDNILVGHILIMLLVDSIIYFIITIYIEAVFPGEYGVAKPWYFFISCFDWRKKHYEIDNDKNKDLTDFMNHEKEPTHLIADIQIKNLRKEYGNKKVALKDLSLNVYRGQITALLGHNGAGKSTTISILTGMIAPSSGTAVVGGCDVSENIAGVRSSLGICSQHNTLFDELTVEEHLYFYSRLKGVPKCEVNNEICKYLHLLEITQKAKTQASKLSGGMKRKLSVSIAFCGNSKVVLCDEPTAGMDPSARRALWDLLLSQKKDRTILLTTHFMDEADLLGDRIAIMSNGKLVCSGSSFFLKKRYGTGYQLILDQSPECDVTKVTELLGKYIENINVHSNIGSELTYMLNEQHVSVFETMLKDLEVKSQNLGIRSYGISLTTLQEVFMKVGSGNEEKDDEKEVGYDNHNFNNSLSDLSDPSENSKELSIEVPTSTTVPLLKSWPLWRNQVSAMFMKRGLSITRSWLLLLIQISVPVVFLLITLLIPYTIDVNDEFPMIHYTLSRYINPVTLITREVNNSYSSNYMNYLDATNRTYINWENQNFSINAIEEAEKDMSSYNTRYIAGASFHSNNSITAWFSNQPYHGTPLALQLVLNTILQTEVASDYNIYLYNHPLPYTTHSKFSKMYEATNIGYQISFNLGFSMAFVSAFYVIFYVQERASKFKHLQFVSGIDVLSFWIPSFVCDIIISILIYLCVIITLVPFQESGFKTFEDLGRIFGLYIAFTFGSLPLMYLSSYWHKVPSSGYVRMSLVNVIIGTGGFMIVELFSTNGLGLEHIAKPLRWIFLLVPHYCFNAGVRDMNLLSTIAELCNAAVETCKELNITSLPCKWAVCSLYNQCCGSPDYFSLKNPGIGKNIFFSCIMGVIFFSLLFLVEYQVFEKIQIKFQKRHDYIESDEPEDDDVSKERRLVEYDVSLGNQKKYNLVLHNVFKNYNKLVAVNKLSLGVNKKECFGLLGVNGAGKTTTFRMVTGDLRMSSGDVWVNGWNTKTNLKQVYQIIGYCPQFDALLDNFTCKETLTIFAMLRGILKKDCAQLITTLALDFDFYQHLNKKVKELSGGNKRKLSTALALVGDPLVLYLDEPTAGVDPATKRYLWNALCKIRDRGTTIVLTSHSMEECEALCTRLAIMVNGSFKCIGSTQHLKSKFSDGYTLTIKTKQFNTSDEQESALDQIENFVKQNFENAAIREKHQEMMTFYISGKNQLWSNMFGIIERGKAILPIEDYSLGQSSLEQVFLTFTKRQREDETMT